MISTIANGKYVNKLSPEKCKEFGEWYKHYKAQSADFPSLDTKGVPKDTRLTFHPKLEIPILKTWFESCKTPSAEKLRCYAQELNKGHVRRERPPVTPARLKTWWKNEKQKERRLQKEKVMNLPERTEEDDTSQSVMLATLDTSPEKPELDEGRDDFGGESPSMQTDVLPSCSFPDML